MEMPDEKILLDPNSYIPLYIQLARMLRAAIEKGQFKAGEKLPSENVLVKRFGISRITATAALDELVKAHLAYRERGRGTFVAQAFLSNFSFFSSFTEDMRARGLEPSSRLVSLHVQNPDLEMIEKLKMGVETHYYCLKRVRLANQEPVVFQSAYLPKAMYPGFEKVDLQNQYLYEVMRKSYGLTPTWGDAIVEAGAATGEEAGYLDIAPGAPVLIIWHVTLDDHFVILEYVRSVYRSDRFSFATGRNPLRQFGK
jgi:GntR family transcriptional regulator